MSDLIVRLIPKEEAERENNRKNRAALKAVVFFFLFAATVSISAALGRALWPKTPESLTTVEAARILHRQKGFAGYSLVSDSSSDSGILGHVIFCPHCGTEIASVNVEFLPPMAPQPGSRMAILTDLAASATAVAGEPKKKRQPVGPLPIVAVAAPK